MAIYSADDITVIGLDHPGNEFFASMQSSDVLALGTSLTALLNARGEKAMATPLVPQPGLYKVADG